MPSQVFISLSERVQKQVLAGTEHEGETELDLDVFYECLAKKQKELEAKGIEDGDSDGSKQVDLVKKSPEVLEDEQKNTLRKRKGGAENSKDSEKEAEKSGKGDAKDGNEEACVSYIDWNTIMKECRISRRISKPISCDHLSEMEIMRLRAEERSYQKSVKHVVNPSTQRLQFGADIKEMNSSIAMATNFIISFIGAFAFGWYACQLFVCDELSIKALCGGVASFATMIVEVTLFLLRDYKQQKEKEKKEKETRRKEGYPVEDDTGSTPGSSGGGAGPGNSGEDGPSDKSATDKSSTPSPESGNNDESTEKVEEKKEEEKKNDHDRKAKQENSKPTETEMVPIKGAKENLETELIERKASAKRAGA